MKTCNTCKANKVCDHNIWGFETCGNYVSEELVEVVRCKECKHATFYSCRNDTCYKGIICEYEIGTTDENFFCSYGERSGT